MPAIHQTQKLKAPVYNDIASQPKLLAYKPMTELRARNIAAGEIAKPGAVLFSLGLAIPFQPSMWDEKSIHSVWNKGLEMVKAKLKGRESEDYTSKILDSLKKLFPKLNYHTHRKSLAILLTPDDEKIFYLDFPVKPKVFLNKSVSLLDLAANMQQQPEFYYFVLSEEGVCLYDYRNKQFRKIYEKNNVTCLETLFKNASNTIEALNGKYEKPVFVTGSPTLVERFCNSSVYAKQFFTVLYHTSALSNEIIQLKIKEIAGQWEYWNAKHLNAKIHIAIDEGNLVTKVDGVVMALSKSADGLLLVDKNLKQKLQKSGKAGSQLQLAVEFMQQLEKFLERGNRIEITEKGLLKTMGGIALLMIKNQISTPTSHSEKGVSIF